MARLGNRSLKLFALEVNTCRYCANRVQSYESAYRHLTRKQTSEYVSNRKKQEYITSRDYKHVSDFPMPLPEFEKLEYEIVPDKFQYVEEYLPKAFHPIPNKEFPTGAASPSGWAPVDETKFRINSKSGQPEHVTQPYIVRRAEDHNIPVYEHVVQGTLQDGSPDIYNEYNVTVVKNISGDIWQLELDLAEEIKTIHEKEEVGSQVDEIQASITFEGFYRYCIRDYLSGEH
ncbi:large ribosomal subunit protein mL49-like isoform X2 [Convolutriloba macropyga]|uniref:large ribosomal subunit protein mL49-like isoform X2 n=1 Tax=Convolutriloba macropyga TaxID=536237 RepID=UPI003F51F9B9